MTRPPIACLFAAMLVLIAACATSTSEAERLEREGEHEAALSMLVEASARAPSDPVLRSALLRQRERTIRSLSVQADRAQAEQRSDAAATLLKRMSAIDPEHPRVVALRAEIERLRRQDRLVVEARQALASGRADEAAALTRQVLAEAPAHAGAQQMQAALRQGERRNAPAVAAAAPAATLALGAGFQKPVTLEFRDAPLRGVLEALARTSSVNFVFDKDVRTDAKVSIFLKDVSVDDALRVILSTQQLDRKVLNESTVFVYPNTLAKQREHQELQTRSFYLTNADVKQAQTLIRTMAKSRDMFIDERLNLIVVRDTAEVLQQVERLLGSLDLPEPEVMLEVEVLEIASDRLDEVGLQWPEQITYGLPGALGSVEIGQRNEFRASIANPALLATLRNITGRSNVLANPRLRARNREKAKLLIGEKLPVFTTTSTANVGVSASVSYLDVGLKLDLEPSVQLDNDVVMKVNLEVSSLISRVLGPQGSIAYQIGTRQATTSLRLRSGETQVLAGLIREEDRKAINGIPVLVEAPLVGRLFGLHSDQRVKTEVVLLITPRVVRNVGVPDISITRVPSGVEASPGAASLRIARSAKVSTPASTGTLPRRPGIPVAPQPATAESAPPPSLQSAASAAEPGSASLVLSTSERVAAGETAAVTLQNRSTVTVRGEIMFDPLFLQSAQGGERSVGRLAFSLPAGGEQVFLLRAQAAATGQVVDVAVISLQATASDGSGANVQVEGSGSISVGLP